MPEQTAVNPPRTYSRVFKHLKLKTILLTRALMPLIWHGEPEVQLSAMQQFINKASEIYEVEVPTFMFERDNMDGYMATGGGMYDPESNIIHMYMKASLVTLLHEFRHMLQYKRGGYQYRNDKEMDARAWSVSLFRKANKRAYRTAVRKGLLHFN